MRSNKGACYEIRMEGILSPSWSGWLEGLDINLGSKGETVLKGQILDQAALFGILLRLHNLNLTLISVVRLDPDQ